MKAEEALSQFASQHGQHTSLSVAAGFIESLGRPAVESFQEFLEEVGYYIETTASTGRQEGDIRCK